VTYGRLRLVGLALAGLTASSCSAGGGASPSTTPGPASPVPGASLPGTVLLLAGTQPDSADVYRLGYTPIHFRRLTQTKPTLGVTWFTAGCCRVIVSDGRQGPSDQVEQLARSGFAPVPGLSDGAKSHPELHSDGVLDYMWQQPGVGSKPDLVHISSFDLATHATRDLVVSVHDIWTYSIRTDGVLAFAERSLDENKGTIVIHGLDGHDTPVNGYSDDPVLLSWGGHDGRLAIGDVQHRATTVLTADGHLSTQLEGWTALTWAPQGPDTLLVTDGPQLATWTLGSQTPQVVGSLTGGGNFYAATWTATDPLRTQS